MNAGWEGVEGKKKTWHGKLKRVTRVWKGRGRRELGTSEIDLAACVLTSYLEKENGFIIH